MRLQCRDIAKSPTPLSTYTSLVSLKLHWWWLLGFRKRYLTEGIDFCLYLARYVRLQNDFDKYGWLTILALSSFDHSRYGWSDSDVRSLCYWSKRQITGNRCQGRSGLTTVWGCMVGVVSIYRIVDHLVDTAFLLLYLMSLLDKITSPLTFGKK